MNLQISFLLNQALESLRNSNLESAELYLKQALRLQANNPHVLRLLGIIFAQRRQYADALKYLNHSLKNLPKNPLTLSNLGNVFFEIKEYSKALEAYDKSIKIDSKYEEAWSNKGNTLHELKRYDEAIAHHDKALSLKPNYAEAWSNKGNTLHELKRYDEAIAHHDKALSLKPNYAEAWSNKGNTLHELKRYDEAIVCCGQALLIRESAEAKVLFAACLRKIQVNSTSSAFTNLVCRAISEAWTRPSDLLPVGKSIVLLNKSIEECISRAANAWPMQISKQELFGDDLLELFADDKLFLAMLENAPLSDIEIERFLTITRRIMLDQAAKECQASENFEALFHASVEKTLIFYCAVARQCFNNEYIYAVTGDELVNLNILREGLAGLMAKGLPVPAIWIATIAAYEPLISLPHIDDVLGMYESGAVYELFKQQVKEPREELNLRDSIPKLTNIDGEISRLVQGQYEENPYPRWIKASVTLGPVAVDDYFRATFPALPTQSSYEADHLDILVAGCGTGQHPIETAHRFKGAKVLAVDLSLSSLCYAKRKTVEFGCANIEYAQADIMELGGINKTFDVIESMGVLHHLADPVAGWKVLLGLLRPKGYMNLGLYSELARQEVVVARSYIAQKGFSAKHEEMRRFRQDLMDVDGKIKFQQLLQFGDFYRMSEFRDLLFHVQEHRYTLTQLKEILTSLGLNFIGFNLPDEIKYQYKCQFPEDTKLTNLDNWSLFEQKNTNTFSSMYQFWVQKNL